MDDKLQTSVTDVYAAGDVCTASWEKADLWLQVCFTLLVALRYPCQLRLHKVVDTVCIIFSCSSLLLCCSRQSIIYDYSIIF